MKRRRRMRALTFLRRHADVAQDVQKLNIQLEDAIKLFTVSPSSCIRFDALLIIGYHDLRCKPALTSSRRWTYF